MLLMDFRDSPAGGVQCFIVALSDAGRELGAFEIPGQRRILDAEKLRDVAVSPLMSILSAADAVVELVAFAAAGGIH